MKQHTALVLAAGLSRRYGADKRLFSDKTPLICRTLQGVMDHFDKVYLIHRHYDPVFLNAIRSFPTINIPAQQDNSGIGDSIAQAMQYIMDEDASPTASISVFLGDMPFISSNTIRQLKSVANDTHIIRPSYQGQYGHPVTFPNHLFNALARIEGDEGAAKVIKDHIGQLLTVEVDDDGILRDIDIPEDWRTLD